MCHVTRTFYISESIPHISNWGNLFLSILQIPPANIKILAMFLRPVSRIKLKNINCGLRFLVFPYFEESWAPGSNIKVRFCVSFPTQPSATGCAEGQICSACPSANQEFLHQHLLSERDVLLEQHSFMCFSKTLHVKGQQKGLLDQLINLKSGK